jgi:hypothetical protein
VGAPHLSEASTYLPSYTGEEQVDSIRKHHTSLEVAMALKSFEEIGYPPKVRETFSGGGGAVRMCVCVCVGRGGGRGAEGRDGVANTELW